MVMNRYCQKNDMMGLERKRQAQEAAEQSLNDMKEQMGSLDPHKDSLNMNKYFNNLIKVNSPLNIFNNYILYLILFLKIRELNYMSIFSLFRKSSSDSNNDSDK